MNPAVRPLVASLMGLIIVLALAGLTLDASPSLSQPRLVAWFYVASLGGTALGLSLARCRPGAGRVSLSVAVGVLLWRVAYFPILVFSGHAAAVFEWTVHAIEPSWASVFPAFLPVVAVLHGAAAFIVERVVVDTAVRRARPALVAAVAAFVVFATAISFTTSADLTPLPDRVMSAQLDPPEAVDPRANPYLPAVRLPGQSPQARALLLAAGLTYDTIPGSPWASGVQGVLEQLFRDNPVGSTADRTREHHLAYLAAHARIARGAE